MDQSDNSDVIGEAIRTSDQNKPLTLADIEFEASEDHSQDLFNDCENSSQDSPSINFDLSQRTVRVVHTPCTLDSLATLSETPKISETEGYSDHPTVPTVPASLVPFITTVNESWTSDLETPQTKITDHTSLRSRDINGQRSVLCETAERRGCGSGRSNNVIPEVTTPSGCFVSEMMENDELSTSPILNTMMKRRRPKRRILKSLIDPSTSINTSTDSANVCHSYAANEIDSLKSEIAPDTLQQNSSSPVNDTTFVIHVNTSPQNCDSYLSQEGGINQRTEARFIEDNTQDLTSNEDDLMNQRLQDSGVTGLNETLKNEENEVRSLKSDYKVTIDSVNNESNELVEEILDENNVTVREFADIPIDIFTRDAKALESADLLPRTPAGKSTPKKHWGLISFTEMCLLEQKNSENKQSNIEDTNDIDSAIENRKLSRNSIDEKDTVVKSEPAALEDDEDMVDIFACSFDDKETESALEFDEFSPWFYQSNEIKSESLTETYISTNVDGKKIGSQKIEQQKNIENNNQSNRQENIFTNLPPLCSTVGFSTASGKPIKIDEEKLKAATKLYDEIALKDENRASGKISSHIPRIGNNRGTSIKNSPTLTGFSTAGGTAIKVDADKLKAATKLYDEMTLQNEKYDDMEILPVIQRDEKKDETENQATIYKNSSSLIGFSTAGGKPLKISEDKLKAAAKLYNEIVLPDERSNSKENEVKIVEKSSCLTRFSTTSGKPMNIDGSKLKATLKLYEDVNLADNTQLTLHSFEVSASRGIKRRHDDYNTDSYEKMEEKSSVGFKTASGKPLIVSESAMKKAKMIYQDENILENHVDCATKLIKNFQDIRMNNSRSNRSELQLTPSENLSKVIPQTSETRVNYDILPGFNTASGKPIKISERALSNAKSIFVEENNDHTFDPLNQVDINRRTVGHLTTVKKSFFIDQENTPPNHSSLKRSSAAMSAAADDIVSLSKTSASKSLCEKNLSEDITPVFTKKVRLNSDLQARKLFGEKGCDTDDEAEYSNKIYGDTDEPRRMSLTSNNNHAHYLLSRKRKKSASLTENYTPGMYAKSEIFETTDRVMNPKLKPEKTGPLNQDIEVIKRPETRSNDNNVKLPHAQKDRKMSTVNDEITASTEALLADEENSIHGRSWASAMTCSPTIVQDRDISAKLFTSGADCGESVQEVPTSPIIGAKIRSRKKHKRNKKNILRKDVMNLRNSKEPDCNGNEELEEQIINQDSQQSSSVATPSSDSSKGSHRNISPVKEATLVSKLQKVFESSRKVQFFDNQSEYDVQLITTDTEKIEEINHFLENRIAATLEQEKKIRAKKKCKPKPILGSLLRRRTENKELRFSWRRATNGGAPTPKTPRELACLGVGSDIAEITAATALRYKFKCSDFYSIDKIRSSVHGLEMGDGGLLIVDENGYVGVAEFERAFLASPGVDPNLVHERWVENHYRWIVWKLASVDKMKFGDLSLPRMLTPHRVMEQLKYRYDREIDKSQRSALRRIMEKDDHPSRRMVLCVATITKLENFQSLEKSPIISTSCYNVELTDGWYSIPSTVDSAMANLISSGKVQEGTKLVTSRAELLNSDQGCFPLEMLGDVSLKIHTNSTRRSKWDAKLGFCKSASPIPSSISAILPNGGLIGKLETTIARVYPMQYFEKTWSGQSIFRNNKCEDRAVMMYEKEREAQIDKIYAETQAKFEAKSRTSSKNFSSSLYDGNKNDNESECCRVSSYDEKLQRSKSCDETSQEAFQKELESVLRSSLPPPRKVTLVLKVRLMDGENFAILTVWAPSEDTIDVLKEGHRVSVHNVQTSGKRSGELQLKAGRQSFVKPEVSAISSFPGRCLTFIPEVAVVGFNPPFGEFDTVGMVVSFGPAPHGMKNFEVVNLAYPNSETSDSAYLSILFWEGIGAHGFSDILTVGSTVACTNLQWRRGAPRTIPTAYSTEHTTFTRNPRKVYLQTAFDTVTNQIKDPMSYASQCAAEITIEHQKKSNITRSPAVQISPCTPSPSALFGQVKLTSASSPRTPQGPATINGEKNTPAKYSVQRRLEKLQWYGEPPDLSPVTLNHGSSKVKQDFVLPVRTPEN